MGTRTAIANPIRRHLFRGFISLMCLAGLLLGTVNVRVANAQGLLGALLRAARERVQSSNSSPALVGMDGPGQSGHRTELVLAGARWTVGLAMSGDFYQSVLECRAQLATEAKHILDAVAFKPLAQKYLGRNVIVVKDGAERDNPIWKIDILTCGGGRPNIGDSLDSETLDAIATSGPDADTILTEASDFVRQIDGSFPPPPTSAQVAQSARDKKYFLQLVTYRANGEMLGGTSDLQLFDTAAECDRYANIKTREVITQNRGRGRVLGTSVVADDGGNGWVWLGCIHPKDEQTFPLSRYVNVKMTDDRAKTMSRFPDLTGSSAPQSKRGSQIKF